MFLAQAKAKEGHRAGDGAMGTFAAQERVCSVMLA